MANIVFRFRVTFEDVDDVERVIDVSGKNTFRDFHNAVQKAINFDNVHPASFFKTNDNWRPYEEFCTEPKATAKAAGASELAKFIDDPHQKLLYIYDMENSNWSLRAEVIKLIKEEPGIIYPNLFKSIGNAPKQFIDPKAIIDDPSGKFFKEADDLIGMLLDEDSKSEEDEEEDAAEDEDDDFNLYGDQVDESEIS